MSDRRSYSGIQRQRMMSYPARPSPATFRRVRDICARGIPLECSTPLGVTAINAYEMSYQSHQAFGCVRNQAQADGQLWHWESGYRHWTRAVALIRPALPPCGDVGDAQSGTLDPSGFRQLPKLPDGDSNQGHGD